MFAFVCGMHGREVVPAIFIKKHKNRQKKIFKKKIFSQKAILKETQGSENINAKENKEIKMEYENSDICESFNNNKAENHECMDDYKINENSNKHNKINQNADNQIIENMDSNFNILFNNQMYGVIANENNIHFAIIDSLGENIKLVVKAPNGKYNHNIFFFFFLCF